MWIEGSKSGDEMMDMQQMFKGNGVLYIYLTICLLFLKESKNKKTQTISRGPLKWINNILRVIQISYSKGINHLWIKWGHWCFIVKD